MAACGGYPHRQHRDQENRCLKPQLEEFGGRNRRLANTRKERNMKIYDWHIAPNPRRLHIYLAEKGIKVDLVEVGQKT
jgi:hypothetical protein